MPPKVVFWIMTGRGWVFNKMNSFSRGTYVQCCDEQPWHHHYQRRIPLKHSWTGRKEAAGRRDLYGSDQHDHAIVQWMRTLIVDGDSVEPVIFLWLPQFDWGMKSRSNLGSWRRFRTILARREPTHHSCSILDQFLLDRKVRLTGDRPTTSQPSLDRLFADQTHVHLLVLWARFSMS